MHMFITSIFTFEPRYCGSSLRCVLCWTEAHHCWLLGPLTPPHSCIFLVDSLKDAVPVGIAFSRQSSRKLDVSVGDGFLSLVPTSLRVQDAQVLSEWGIKKKKKMYFCHGQLLKKIWSTMESQIPVEGSGGCSASGELWGNLEIFQYGKEGKLHSSGWRLLEIFFYFPLGMDTRTEWS